MTEQKYLEAIKKFRLIDDTFFSACFDNNATDVQYILRIILEKPDLKVLKVQTQKSVENMYGRSVRFDVFATDEAGKLYNIEVQRTDAGAIPTRARYNSSMLDYHELKKKAKHNELPETFVIFITEHDVLKDGEKIYHIDRIIRETNKPFGDGTHIIYVNGSYKGEKGKESPTLSAKLHSKSKVITKNNMEKVDLFGDNSNNTIQNGSSNVKILARGGNDSIYNIYGKNVTIDSGDGNDSVRNASYCPNATINGGKGDDYIYDEGSNVTITGGEGNDSLYLNWDFKDNRPNSDNNASNVLFQYNPGDGDDTIYGFKDNSTLLIGGNTYTSTKSGNNIIVTVGKGKINLVGAAKFSNLNIATEKPTNTSATL